MVTEMVPMMKESKGRTRVKVRDAKDLMEMERSQKMRRSVVQSPTTISQDTLGGRRMYTLCGCKASCSSDSVVLKLGVKSQHVCARDDSGGF